ncbi:MAG: thiosulfate oxidation carrier complex protein SoxZ [Pseudomonadota bacterium]|nr:thiosulfate oxidation carrier complex protein SoxZ [Pseudomonadota bacterium]
MSTKIKIKQVDGGHNVLCLVKHPMETGLRKDPKTGEAIPAHHITTMNFQLNGADVAQANLGSGVSKNPLTGIRLTGAKSGDKVSVTWVDNKGEGETAEAAVK